MFPAIHGVVPLNCPKDTNTYINRVRRTARYEDGKAFLLPSENESIFILEVPPDKKDFYSYTTHVNSKKVVLVQRSCNFEDVLH